MNCKACGHDPMLHHRLYDGSCIICQKTGGPCFPWEFR